MPGAASRLLAAIGAAVLAGCAGHPTLERWSRVEGLPASAPPSLFVSSAPAQAGDPLTLKGLAERTGAAYVAALAAKAKSAKDLQAALAGKIAAPASGTNDTTRIGRVLLVGVQRAQYRPGDRLLTTKISIRPLGFRFTDYALAATDRSVVNIGAVSVSDQRSANFALAPGAAATVTEGLAGGVTASRTETGTRTITANTELSVNVSPDFLQIYRSGAEGSDLTGATLVKLALQLPEADTVEYAIAAVDLTQEDGGLKPPAKAKISTHFLAANPARDLYVCARLDYEDRTVLAGAESYDEGRQSVRITPGHTDWAPFLVAPYQDIETPLWIIMTGDGALQFDNGLRRVTLTFDDYDDARDLTFWLQRTQARQIANGKLLAGTVETPLPVVDFDHLKVTRVGQTRADPAQGSTGPPDCQGGPAG